MNDDNDYAGEFVHWREYPANHVSGGEIRAACGRWILHSKVRYRLIPDGVTCPDCLKKIAESRVPDSAQGDPE